VKPFAITSKATSTTTRLATGSLLAAKTISLILTGLPNLTSSDLEYNPLGSSNVPVLVTASLYAPETTYKTFLMHFLI
jgi:hypothetical protein